MQVYCEICQRAAFAQHVLRLSSSAEQKNSEPCMLSMALLLMLPGIAQYVTAIPREEAA